ncbi:hypothetical protein BH11CYA1_BH11CYA1_12080 [soil metagenome]
MATLAQVSQTNHPTQNARTNQNSSAPASNVRHLQLAPGCGNKPKAKELPPVTSNLGLIELDVALTKLAISKPESVLNEHRVATDASNDTVFFRWGQSHNKRSFALNADGSAQYMVKMGETIISIVECLLRETHRMFPNYEPTYREIRDEINALRLANLGVRDLDQLKSGQWVTIPALIVCEALTGQGSTSKN